MDVDRWQRLRELFDAAIGLESKERAEYLDEACRADPALRRQVESLILSSEAAPPLITAAVGEARAAAGALLRAGDRIGAYEVVQELGRGGMGAVYLGTRADTAFRKQVAIKLARRDVASPELLHRFVRERQILAALEHPNIARLLDGGTTETGAPYVVMEFVEGQPIDAYCDKNRLPIAERLRLFRGVCSAVHYAHQNLIVHRDVKPGNILVTSDGVPKLLDFGIAKLLDPDLYPQTLPVTQAADRLLTPAYASPEQVRGEPVTTASDIYSLGVLLYELLTGHQPYKLKTTSPRELERAITEQEPERPSSVPTRVAGDEDGRLSRARGTTPQRLRRNLAGDLDHVVLMSLRKEPGRRYGSVERFSEDIARYLDGRPVVARHDTWSYRTGKFVRRHRLAVAASAAFVLLLVGFGATMAWQASRIARERDRVVLERENARVVSDFLVDLFRVSDPGQARGNSITAREVLDKGSRKIEQDLAGQPAVQARLMHTMGQVYTSLGLYDEAESLLVRSWESRRELVGADHPETLASLENLANQYWYQGRYAEAEKMHVELLDKRRRVLGEEHIETLQVMKDLADDYLAQGRLGEAESLYVGTLATYRRTLGGQHAKTIDCMNALAIVYAHRGQFDKAEPLFVRTVEARRAGLGADHPTTLRAVVNLGGLYYEQGRLAEAESLYGAALETRRRVLGPEHPHTLTSMNNLASVYVDSGRLDEAERLLLEALEVRSRVLGKNHPDIAQTLYNLGRVYFQQGRLDEAEPIFLEAIEIDRSTLGEEHHEAGLKLRELGRLRRAQSKLDEARSLFARAIDILEPSLGSGHSSVVSLLEEQAALLRELGRESEASVIEARARRIEGE